MHGWENPLGYYYGEVFFGPSLLERASAIPGNLTAPLRKTIMMTIEEAIHKVEKIWRKGTSGGVIVDGSGVYRYMTSCRLCEGTTMWGTITVKHEDGDMLAAIMADA